MELARQIALFAEEVLAKAGAVPSGRRYMLGITGIPAAGKSTLAALLVGAINAKSGADSAGLLPMDGFHLPNDLLEARGIRHLKGIPATFDAAGFVKLLSAARDRGDQNILCPAYDRRLHAPVADALVVSASHRVVITEGNYLLYDSPPWSDVVTLLDEVWFLSAPMELAIRRLTDRHVAGGRTREEARSKIESTDLPNAALVERTRPRADRILTLDGPLLDQP
jgi:pantothenate kinase